MKQKRVLIASFVLIILGLFLIIGPETSITGAVVGVQGGVLDSTSNVLFGFFLVWIAGIMLIGGVEEKVINIEELKKRQEQIGKWSIDHDYESVRAYVNAIESTGKKPRELKVKERQQVVDKIYEARKDDYLNFVGIKNQGNYLGKQSLKTMYLQTANVTKEDDEGLKTLTSEGLANSSKNSIDNIVGKLSGYTFSDLKEKDISALGKEFGKKLGVDKDKVISINDTSNLYKALINKENSEYNVKQITDKYKKEVA